LKAEEMNKPSGHSDYALLLREIKNDSDVLAWFEEETRTGNTAAAYILACVYKECKERYNLNDFYANINNRKAFYLFENLANNGNVAAMCRLAEMCSAYIYLKNNAGDEKAMFWYEKAAKLGDKKAAECLKELREKMKENRANSKIYQAERKEKIKALLEKKIT